MSIRGLAAAVTVGCSLLLAACGGGSGRQGTDIVVTGTGPSAPVQAGSTAVFEMTVANTGALPAEGVSVTNLVGNQLALTAITCSARGGAACPATTAVAMTLPTLPAGSSLTFTVTTQLSGTASGTVSNTLSASYDTDTDRGNNAATVSASAFNIVSNLVVGGTGPGGTVTGGGTAAFQMTVRNDGPDAATGLQIVNNVGGFLIVREVVCTASGGAACPAVPGVVMDVPSLPSGGLLTFTVSAAVASGVNGTVTNTLQVSAPTDNNRADNSFTATATVVTATSGVFVTGVGPSANVTGGGTAVFTMTVSNSGPDAATDVQIVDNVGSNLTFTGISCLPAGGAVCPGTLGPVMSVPSLPAGGTLTFTVNALVAGGTSGALTNAMSVSAANDANRADNTATAVATAVTPRATLAVGGTGPAAPVAGGETAVFLMTVANTGPDAASGLRVVNTVGGNLTFIGATCTAAGGAVCPAAVGVVTDVGNLPVGGQLTFAVSAVVGAGANGAITNTLQATASNSFSLGGNSAVAVGTAATARSNLSVTGVAPSSVPAGGPASFSMTVSNAGPQAASAVRLTNVVGGNLTLTGITCSASGGAACPASVGPVMDVPSLPVGGTLVFNVATAVAAGTQGAIVNTLTAAVTSGTRSEVSGVAVGNAYTTSVGVSGTGPASPQVGGATVSFSMLVSNAGPGTATDVEITNTLGSGLTAAGAIGCVAGGGAVCPASTGATMVAPSIPAGGFLSFNVPATVAAGANGSVANTMTVNAAGDIRVLDNSANVSFNAVSTDVGVTQSGATQVSAGDTVVFTAVVANPGPGAATGLTFTHALSGAAGTSASILCTPVGAASCPAVLGPQMSLSSLGAGRSLVFTITAPVASNARGAITSSFSITAEGDPNTANNTTSVTTQAVDARNGSYKAFAADGRLYDFSIDFDAGSYTLTGNGTSVVRSFTADLSGGGYTVSGNARLRTATDLVVGGHDFGSGVLPFVAARTFSSNLSGLAGTYNLATRNVYASTPAITRAGTAQISGNTISVCQNDNAEVRSVRDCIAAARKDYQGLSLNGTVATGTTAGGETFSFMVATSGGARVLLSAGPAPDGSQQLRIGLPESTAGFTFGPSTQGASSTGDWVTMTLTDGTPVTWTAVGQTTNDSASLVFPAPTLGPPFSMLTGTSATFNSNVYVLQASPLVVALGGAPPFGGGASGLFIVGLP